MKDKLLKLVNFVKLYGGVLIIVAAVAITVGLVWDSVFKKDDQGWEILEGHFLDQGLGAKLSRDLVDIEGFDTWDVWYIYAMVVYPHRDIGDALGRFNRLEESMLSDRKIIESETMEVFSKQVVLKYRHAWVIRMEYKDMDPDGDYARHSR